MGSRTEGHKALPVLHHGQPAVAAKWPQLTDKERLLENQAKQVREERGQHPHESSVLRLKRYIIN